MGSPETIQLISDAEQAQAAVQRAVDSGTAFAVRGGGHCYEDFVFNSEV
ncbi:hypothetical protein [Glutamicibacter sp. V16R2B1]|nr:hypothetical protein [Glutamicibacter sp. V16R2B1]